MLENKPYEDWDIKDYIKYLMVQCESIMSVCVEEDIPLPMWIEDAIIEIQDQFYNYEYDFRLQYDGCSYIQDPKHPCLECSVHDYLWKTGRAGAIADRMYYHIGILSAHTYDDERLMRRWIRKTSLRYKLIRIGFVLWKRRKHEKLYGKKGLTNSMMSFLLWEKKMIETRRKK